MDGLDPLGSVSPSLEDAKPGEPEPEVPAESGADPSTTSNANVDNNMKLRDRRGFLPPRRRRTVGAELLPELLAMIEQRADNTDKRNRNQDPDSTVEVRRPTFAIAKRVPAPDEFGAPAPARELKRRRTDNNFKGGNGNGNHGVSDRMEIVEPEVPCPEISRMPELGCNSKLYSVLYSKPTTKKHKTWDGDGFLTVVEDGKEVILRDESNQILGTAYNYKLPDNFGEGTQLQIGGKVVEIQELQSVGASNPCINHTNNSSNELRNPSASGSSRAWQPQSSSVSAIASAETRSPQLPRRRTSDSNSELLPVEAEADGEGEQNSNTTITVYNVLYAKPTTKKHKTWEGDGTLTVIGNGREMILRNEDEQIVASTTNFKLPDDFGDGTQIKVGGKVVEIQEQVSSRSTSMNTSVNNQSAHAGPSVHQFNREFRQPASGHFQQPKSSANSEDPDCRFSVLYAPPLIGKYARWEGDGILTVVGNGKEIVLADDNGTILQTVSNFKLQQKLEEGAQLQIGDKFIEISRKLGN